MALSAEVAKKYKLKSQAFANCKLSWPFSNKHGVDAKKASELTLAEADKLFEAGAANGVLELLPVEIAPAGNIQVTLAAVKTETPKNGKNKTEPQAPN